MSAFSSSSNFKPDSSSDSLSDKIDESLDSIIPVSSELLSSLSDESVLSSSSSSSSSSNSNSSNADDDITQSDLTKAEALLNEFEDLEHAQAEHIARRTQESLFQTVEANEEYFKSIASMLYLEVHKQAKKYLKNWCVLNNYTQKWSNPFSKPFNIKSLTAFSAFIPKVYSLSIVNKESGQVQVLCDMMPTAREASIAGAKILGFDTSPERKLAFAKFSHIAIDRIVNDARYLQEQKQLHIFEEHRRQVEARSYVPKSLRDKWLREIQNNTAFVGGII